MCIISVGNFTGTQKEPQLGVPQAMVMPPANPFATWHGKKIHKLALTKHNKSYTEDILSYNIIKVKANQQWLTKMLEKVIYPKCVHWYSHFPFYFIFLVGRANLQIDADWVGIYLVSGEWGLRMRIRMKAESKAPKEMFNSYTHPPANYE